MNQPSFWQRQCEPAEVEIVRGHLVDNSLASPLVKPLQFGEMPFRAGPHRLFGDQFRCDLGDVADTKFDGKAAERLMREAALAGAMNLRMTGKNLFNEGCAGPRQPEDKNRAVAGVAKIGASGKEIARIEAHQGVDAGVMVRRHIPFVSCFAIFLLQRISLAKMFGGLVKLVLRIEDLRQAEVQHGLVEFRFRQSERALQHASIIIGQPAAQIRRKSREREHASAIQLQRFPVLGDRLLQFAAGHQDRTEQRMQLRVLLLVSDRRVQARHGPLDIACFQTGARQAKNCLFTCRVDLNRFFKVYGCFILAILMHGDIGQAAQRGHMSRVQLKRCSNCSRAESACP